MAKRTITPELCSAQEKSFPTRKLKVRRAFYDYLLSSSPSTYKAPPPVPWIELKGYWLNKAGFPIGTFFHVEVSEGCLVLKAIQAAPKLK
ncbi:MAG: SymE family type I addiction module toxin [Pseudomonadota bacterium]